MNLINFFFVYVDCIINIKKIKKENQNMYKNHLHFIHFFKAENQILDTFKEKEELEKLSQGKVEVYVSLDR